MGFAFGQFSGARRMVAPENWSSAGGLRAAAAGERKDNAKVKLEGAPAGPSAFCSKIGVEARRIACCCAVLRQQHAIKGAPAGGRDIRTTSGGAEPSTAATAAAAQWQPAAPVKTPGRVGRLRRADRVAAVAYWRGRAPRRVFDVEC